MKGTCYTTSECTNKGGTSGGNCAAGKHYKAFVAAKNYEKINKGCKELIKTLTILRFWCLLHVHVRKNCNELKILLKKNAHLNSNGLCIITSGFQLVDRLFLRYEKAKKHLHSKFLE